MMNKFVRWFLPTFCICCQQPFTGNFKTICDNCYARLPWLSDRCYSCAAELFQDNESIWCSNCLSDQSPIDEMHALCGYDEKLQQLIKQLKFGGKLYVARLFADLLYQKITTSWYPDGNLPEVIVPVPLHLRRFKHRGYNQIRQVLKLLNHKLAINIEYDVCKRIKYTQAQAKLSKTRRRINIRNAFAIPEPSKLQGISSVVLVDDVYTTGSTLNALAAEFKQHGVDYVSAWILCRA